MNFGSTFTVTSDSSRQLQLPTKDTAAYSSKRSPVHHRGLQLQKSKKQTNKQTKNKTKTKTKTKQKQKQKQKQKPEQKQNQKETIFYGVRTHC